MTVQVSCMIIGSIGTLYIISCGFGYLTAVNGHLSQHPHLSVSFYSQCLWLFLLSYWTLLAVWKTKPLCLGQVASLNPFSQKCR